MKARWVTATPIKDERGELLPAGTPVAILNDTPDGRLVIAAEPAGELQCEVNEVRRVA